MKATVRTTRGSDPGIDSVLSDYRSRIRGAAMPWGIRKEAVRQLRRLRRTHEGTFEHYMVRGYLEAVIEMPWAERIAAEERLRATLLAPEPAR